MDTKRTRISLNGKWHLWTDPDEALSPTLLDDATAINANVPAPIQEQRLDLHLYTGSVWYRRLFDLPADWPGSPVILGFDAADYRAEVWLNGKPLGDHCGGYLPFELDASQAIQSGRNTLVVRVSDPPEWFAEIPHGKQSWYGPLSGLWQPVWAEKRSACHIRHLSVRTDEKTGRVSCKVEFSAPAPAGSSLVARVMPPTGAAVELLPVEAGAGRSWQEWDFTIASVQAWSLATPNLYHLEVSLICQGEACDGLEKTFGFRTIETKDGRLYLNGELLYLRGALDQDYYPGTICTPPSVAFVEDEMRKAKALGLNCLRIHIKIPDPIYYDVADRVGILVWTELPSFTVLTDHSASEARQTYEGILARDGHHPSIMAWTIINENWGLDLPNDPAHRRWLGETYNWLKQQDPSRLVIDNSACTPNFHIQSDLDDFHYYRGMPDHQKQWQTWLAEFASRPGWTYSPFGDARRSGKEPLILSEFGNWGLPDANLLRDDKGQDPWWFVDTGHDWAEGIVYPHGVQSRFKTMGLDRVFESWESFIEDTQWYQFMAMKFEIETMRLHESIQGYVITEFTDVHWECNGLMDMERHVKAYGKQFPEINADIVVVATFERTAWWSDEPIPVTFNVANGTGQSLRDCRLHWKAPAWGSEGFLPIHEIGAGKVAPVGVTVIPAAATRRPSRERLSIELLDGEAKKLAENSYELSLYPRRDPTAFGGRLIWCADATLSKRLTRSGYTLVPSPEKASVLIAGKIDQTLLQAVNLGAKLLLMIEQTTDLKEGIFGLGTTAREGTLSGGDWASSFGWLRRDGPFTNIPGGPLLDDSFEPFIPEINLTGFGLADFQSSRQGKAGVFSGQFLGWVHKPAAWIGRRSYGKGQVVVTTYRLKNSAAEDNPVAAGLLDGLISLAEEENEGFSCEGQKA